MVDSAMPTIVGSVGCVDSVGEVEPVADPIALVEHGLVDHHLAGAHRGAGRT